MRLVVLVSMFTMIAAIKPAYSQSEEPHDQTKAQACLVLKHTLAKIEGLPGGKPYKHWVCDFWDFYSDRYFFVIALKSTPASGSGVDHMMSAGEWAVSKRGSLVLQFNLNEESISAIADVYYAKKPVTRRNPTDSLK